MKKRVELLMDDTKRQLVLPDLVIFETKRTQQRQAELYGLGRGYTAMMWAYPRNPAYWCYNQPTAVKRTWTTQSRHLSGQACDFAFEIDGKITWSVPQDYWDILVELGEKYAMRSLAPKEYAHLELEFPLKPLKMPEEFTIPEWAKESCLKAKKKGVVTKNYDEPISAYRLCAILDNLGLLD